MSDLMFITFLVIVFIPVIAYIDTRIVKLHSFQQYLFINFIEIGLFLLGIWVGVNFK